MPHIIKGAHNPALQPIAAHWAAPADFFVILKRLTNYPCQKSLEMYIQMMYN
jgi:hypothetical protein